MCPAIGSMSKTTVLNVHTFLWCPLHNCHVEPPNVTFYGGREHTTMNFPKLSAVLKRRDKVWKNTNYFFQRRFQSLITWIARNGHLTNKPSANGRKLVGQQLPTLTDITFTYCVRLLTCCMLLCAVAQSLISYRCTPIPRQDERENWELILVYLIINENKSQIPYLKSAIIKMEYNGMFCTEPLFQER